MVRRTMLQLFILTIINIEQIEVRAQNKTDNLEKPVHKFSAKASKTDRNYTVLIKNTYTDYDQRSDKNLDSKCDILRRNKHNLKNNHIHNEETDSDKSQEQESDENITSNTKITSSTELTSLYNRKKFSKEKKLSKHADDVHSNNRILVTVGQKTAIEKIKQESATELDTNDESSLKIHAGKKNPTVQRRKRLTVRHHITKVSTTEAMTDKLLISKTTHSWGNEVNNEIICKTKNCDYNHRSFEKISRENDIYRLKRRDETKSVSKRANKLKHSYSKRNRAFKGTTLLENMSNSKYSDLSDTLSKENEMYKQEQVNESVEVPVSQTKSKRKPKLTHNFQTKNKNKVTKKVTDKAKHKSKTKHRFDKVKPNKGKKKSALNDKTITHTDLRIGDSGSINSEDTLNLNEADTQTQENQVMKEIQDSSEELFNENHFLNKPILPFYVSSTTPTTNEIAKYHPIKQDVQKDEKKYTEILLNDLNSVLKENSDLTNQKIDLNKMINLLTSSKIFDFITERVAGHMLKKLQNSQTFQNNFRTKNVKPEKVEHIDILFKRDGDMVMMNRENLMEKNTNLV